MPNTKENKPIYIALGSNLGDREQNLQQAITEIGKHAEIIKKSSIIETEALGYKDQGKFLNMVIEVSSTLEPEPLLKTINSIEEKLGRTRPFKNAPRTIDLDILFFGNRIVALENLKIPHPEIQNRLFVLGPMEEIAPNFIHPILKKNITALKNGLTKN